MEIIVVDGGSSDTSVEVAKHWADQVLQSPPGRARQMNLGASQASGEWLWFLHADTGVSSDHAAVLANLPKDRLWGRFDVRFERMQGVLGLVALLMNHRSRLTGVATGDQGLFVRRDLFEKLGGYPSMPLMEDVALCKVLRKYQRPLCVPLPLLIDDRRWRRRGVWQTILLMWQIRLMFWLGVSPKRLHRLYYPDHLSGRENKTDD